MPKTDAENTVGECPHWRGGDVCDAWEEMLRGTVRLRMRSLRRLRKAEKRADVAEADVERMAGEIRDSLSKIAALYEQWERERQSLVQRVAELSEG